MSWAQYFAHRHTERPIFIFSCHSMKESIKAYFQNEQMHMVLNCILWLKRNKQIIESEKLNDVICILNVMSDIFSLCLCVCFSSSTVSCWKCHKVILLSSSGIASPSASSSLFILSYSLVPSSSSTSPPTPPPPSLPVKIVQSCWQSISREDSRQTVCFSAGCFRCIVAETLSDCISPELLKQGFSPST